MVLIIGLGNPGKKYEGTRHNIGRLAVSSWQQKTGLPDFKLEKKFNALVSKGFFEESEVILVLPETFMNLSGKAVKSIIARGKKYPADLWLLHDDIDLPLGKIRIAKNRGTGGHKGVESVIKELKNKNFIRFRIGIQPKSGKPKNVETFVIKKFVEGEKKIAEKVLAKTNQAIEMMLTEGLEKAMNAFNG